MRTVLALSVLAGCGWAALAQEARPDKEKPGGANVAAERKSLTWDKAASALDFVVTDIDGKEVDLAKHRGSVVLIVNVASNCGFTKQYKELQALHKNYAEKGLRILAFPSNDFGGQEPLDNEAIKGFCQKNYSVEFDLFAKVQVKGEQSAPLFRFLTAKEKNEKFGGELKWNFTKFLVDRKGQVIARFEPRVKPDDPEVIRAIEAALESKP